MPFTHATPATTTARVVVLAGPSGSGKTHVANASGLPIVTLDDFYRDGDDAGMPRLDGGIVDWEDPASWNQAAAVAALVEICACDHIEVPTYSFGEDRATGHRTIQRGNCPVVIAEGIFAAELVAPLRDAGVLADALLVHPNRWVTFVRRFLRDLRDGRKAPTYLVRQGWAKTMAEPAVVARQRALGCRPVSKSTARRRLADLRRPRSEPAVDAASNNSVDGQRRVAST